MDCYIAGGTSSWTVTQLEARVHGLLHSWRHEFMDCYMKCSSKCV